MALAAATVAVSSVSADTATPLEAAPFYDSSGTRHGVFLAIYDEETCSGSVSIHLPRCLAAAPTTIPGLGNFTAFATTKGPDSFYIRVQGRESVALGLHDLTFHNCTYMTRRFELRRAGRYEVAVWHLYDNYGAWPVDDAVWPPYIGDYMAIARDGAVLPPSHTAVLTCNRGAAEGERTRPQLPLCAGNEHVPGRWVEAGHHRVLDWASMTHRHRARTRSISYEADNCRIDGNAMLETKVNITIYIVGDSHFRTLANGFAHALEGATTPYHLANTHELLHADRVYGNGMRIVYCPFFRPGQWVEQCAPHHLDSTDAVVVTGTAAWPLCTVDIPNPNHVQTPDEYAVGLAEGTLREWGAWLDAAPGRRLIFMSSTATPLYHSDWLVQNHDHRNNFRNTLYDCIAARAVVHQRMRFLDVFALSYPVSHLSLDHAHYMDAVLRETVVLVWQAIVMGDGGGVGGACGGVR